MVEQGLIVALQTGLNKKNKAKYAAQMLTKLSGAAEVHSVEINHL